jgi:hypothetical protein
VNTNIDLNRRASLRPYLGAPGGESPSGDSTIKTCIGGDGGVLEKKKHLEAQHKNGTLSLLVVLRCSNNSNDAGAARQRAGRDAIINTRQLDGTGLLRSRILPCPTRDRAAQRHMYTLPVSVGCYLLGCTDGLTKLPNDRAYVVPSGKEPDIVFLVIR